MFTVSTQRYVLYEEHAQKSVLYTALKALRNQKGVQTPQTKEDDTHGTHTFFSVIGPFPTCADDRWEWTR